MSQLLLVEDDAETAAEIVAATRVRGHYISHVMDGKTRLNPALAGHFDVVVTDRMLPGLDGLGMVKALHESDKSMPVIMLTALDSVDERIKGMRAGGDDYLGKPFAIGELLARIESWIRRHQQIAITSLQIEDPHLDLLDRTTTRASRALDFTTREFRLLEYFVRHTG